MTAPVGDLTGSIARVRDWAGGDVETTTLRGPVASPPEGMPRRRGVELFACLIAAVVGVGGYFAVAEQRLGHLPDGWQVVVPVWVVLCVGVHIVVRLRAPYADPVILPCVLLLNGVGLDMIYRLDQYLAADNARTQFTWTIVALVAFGVVLVWLRDYRVLQRYPYILFLIGLGLLLLPLIPHLGVQINGSRIWIHLGSYSFQPAEVAKIVLALAFASYLSDRREMLRHAGRTVGRLTLPRLRDLAPIGLMFVASIVVLVFQNDLGTSLLFFGLFVMMLYLATGQGGWVVLGLVAFVAACWVVYTYAGHVQTRVEAWLHPFAHASRDAQIIEAQYGMAWGGLLGRGWGNGAPGRIPLANSDFIAAALGEELGIVGLMAIVVIYGILVARGLRIGLAARDGFGKLLASGLAFIIALQVFAIIGGVTRLLPLTGLTTPFMSQGGSSLLANWIIVAVMLRISDQARRPVVEVTPAPIVELEGEATQLVAGPPAAEMGQSASQILGDDAPTQDLSALAPRLSQNRTSGGGEAA